MKPAVEIPKPTSKVPATEQPSTRLEDKIRERAYELYEKRGRIDGNEVDDWLLAESEIAKQPKAA